MATVPAYAARDAGAPLAPFSIERRTPGPDDVQIEILYCGVCHTDIDLARSCAAHGIAADVELIAIDQVNQAWERMLAGDVRYRFVIDMASLRGA